MELKQIHYFTEVVKQGSFSKAAEQLYISQPNISNVIKDLEKELDVTLLNRTTRKLELTDTGKLFFQYGQQIFQSLQSFYQELDDVKNRKTGAIKIGIFPMLGMHFFTEILAEFHRQYPGISIRFEEDGAYNLKKSLIQGELDLVVMPLPIEKEEFDFLPFLKGDLRILVHKHHVLANKEEVAWSDLQNEDFIIFREGFSIRDTIFEECRRLGFEPTIICESSQWNFMIEMVSIKQGIAILPQSTQKELDFTGKQIKVLRLTDPQINWQLGIAWRKESYISNATKTWINFVKDRLKQD